MYYKNSITINQYLMIISKQLAAAKATVVKHADAGVKSSGCF